MTRIDIHREHTLDHEQAQRAVRHIAESIEQRFGLTPQWDGDTLRFARSGVDGSIEMGDGQVRIQANLGLLLTPLKPTVEAEIRRKLDKYFPAAG